MEPAAFDRGVIPLLLAMLLLLVAGSAPGRAQQSGGGAELADKLKNNVVAIRAFWGDGSEHDGFGFMVGSRGGNIYVATAAHVVREIDSTKATPDTVAKKIEIVVFERKGQTFQGTLLGTDDPSLDVAVITARLPNDISWHKDVLASKPAEKGTEVWFVGRDKDWYVPGRPGVVNSIDKRHRRIKVDDLPVREGTSGAPLVADGGIVGMIVDDDALTTEATPIEEIQLAFREWRHPWDLRPLEPPDGNGIFQIPTANIKIDGNFGDWQGIQPVFKDPPNDKDPAANFPGTDLKAFYLARDNRYLYLAMTLYDGPPRQDLDTWYFFVAQQQQFEVDIRGDREAAVKFSGGNWKVWTAERGNGGQPVREPRFYSSDFVKSGPNFIEWKVPWQEMGQLNGRFVRVYTHVVKQGVRQNISEENLPGIELKID